MLNAPNVRPRTPMRQRAAAVAAVLLALPVAVALGLLTACAPMPTAPAAPTLYQQLGGAPRVQAVVARVVDASAQDPRTSRSFVGVRLSSLKQSIAAHLCVVADGTACGYEGETLRNAHADLALTGSDFDLMVAQLRRALDAEGVDTAAKNELLRRLAPARRDIVTAGPTL